MPIPRDPDKLAETVKTYKSLINTAQGLISMGIPPIVVTLNNGMTVAPVEDPNLVDLEVAEKAFQYSQQLAEILGKPIPQENNNN